MARAVDAVAWRLRPRVRDVDLVISSSHACAKAVRIETGIPHLCYCHTPMRYAWDFDAERDRFPALLRPLAPSAMALFRRWDRRTAERVTRFVANSQRGRGSHPTCYGREAAVIHPPVRTDFFTPGGERGDAFLWVGRFVGYKRPDLVVEAFAGLPGELIMVGDGPLRSELARRATPERHLPRPRRRRASSDVSIGPRERSCFLRTRTSGSPWPKRRRAGRR